MADPGPERARAHFEVLARVRAGTLSGAERAAVAMLLDRALIATLLDEEDDTAGPGARRPSSRWRHVSEAYDALLATEPDEVPAPRAAGGAEVTPIRRARP